MFSALTLMGIVVAAQAWYPTLIYLREQEPPLAAEDVRTITKLAESNGGVAWVIAAYRTSLGGQAWVADVYLKPAPRHGIRRGQLLSIVAPLEPGPRVWTIKKTADYAHIPVRGQQIDLVRHARDTARPFEVLGKPTDEEIWMVVNVLRASPHYVGERSEGTVDGKLPIRLLERVSEGKIRARLGDSVMSGQEVTLQRIAYGWVVVQLSNWVV